jgi:hypothetical protein
MTEDQIDTMIESLEELNEELSIQSKGMLCMHQLELLEHLKIIKNEYTILDNHLRLLKELEKNNKISKYDKNRLTELIKIKNQISE